MKKVLSILSLVLSSLVIILGLVFIFIEGRLLFSLDWIIYENAFTGFIRYLFRFLLATIAIGTGILDFINLKRNNKLISFTILCGVFGFVIMSLVMLLMTTNYIQVVCLVVSLLLVVINLVKLKLDGLL